MNLIHKIKFNEQNEIEETFLFNGQEITETQFVGLSEDLKSDFNEDYEEEYECNCECCGEDNLEDIIHNVVADICNTDFCPYCVEDKIREFIDDLVDYLEE